VRELAAAIYKFGKHWNDVLRRLFEWTYSGRVLRQLGAADRREVLFAWQMPTA